MCRSEFLEAIVRLATNIKYPKIAHVNPVKAVKTFLEQNLCTYAHKSEVLIVRKLLRSDMCLNNFLYYNRALTKGLYIYWRDSNGFRLRSAFLCLNFNGTRDLASKLSSDDLRDGIADSLPNIKRVINLSELKRQFLFS
jgi:hypothetical protein